ncbi:MAG: hypothetical protein ACXW4B_09035 [Micavibrio sp.]
MQDHSSGESGNILFLILIAVVLFAALIFAVTMSERGGEDVNQDNVRVAAAQIIQSGVDIETAILRLRVSKGLNESEISFETPLLPAYAHAGCTTDRCRVFMPDGGQISYPRPNPEWLNRAFAGEPHFGGWLYTGTACIPGIGNGADATCNANPQHLELLAVLPWITRDMCVEINEKLSLSPANGDPPQLTGAGWAAGGTEFTGAFGSGETMIDAGNLLFARPEGCFEGSGTPPAGSYHYYRAILAR